MERIRNYETRAAEVRETATAGSAGDREFEAVSGSTEAWILFLVIGYLALCEKAEARDSAKLFLFSTRGIRLQANPININNTDVHSLRFSF